MKTLLVLLNTLFIFSLNAQFNTDSISDKVAFWDNSLEMHKDQIKNSETISLKHHKSQKTILFKVGDQIKVKEVLGNKVKGEIISISNGYISIVPNKNKSERVDSIDVNQLKWIKKYNDCKGARVLGVAMKVIGTIGTSFFVLGTTAAIDAGVPELAIVGAGGIIGTMGVYIGGGYIQGARRHIGQGKWRLIK